ncbi:VOC family protein [Hahella sp. CR1]|uniref:VOC family protein n=1 Tax=Hahella sp. CR1 TaxID=2992807 RepID=UPI002441C38F|nr:VOC family protein [Hahella sp. CR1]MDG9670665.1 VOC family protein [Hahella sp. CR1]
MELDHIFICVSEEAPEGDLLTAFGLTEGSANTHPGQGTANRRFFFHNAFIELLYLNDPEEADSALTRPTMLLERLTQRGAAVSPFGFCFRPETGKERSPAPFKSWDYRPKYLPETLRVEVAESPLSEPMWFYLEFAGRPDQAAPERAQPLTHATGFREITRVCVTSPNRETPSDAAILATTAGGFEMSTGDESLLEIGFDHEKEGKHHDFRPHLPLVFRW